MLQPPVVEIEVKPDGTVTGNYLVTIGEGRRQALRMLARRKAIRKPHPVRVILDSDNDAHEISLDENITRREDRSRKLRRPIRDRLQSPR